LNHLRSGKKKKQLGAKFGNTRGSQNIEREFREIAKVGMGKNPTIGWGDKTRRLSKKNMGPT